MVLNSKKVIENVNLEGHTGYIYIYDKNNDIICNVLAWNSGYIGFGKEIKKEYKIEFNDINGLKELLEK